MANTLVVTRERISIVSQGGKQGLPGATGEQGKPGAPGGTVVEYAASGPLSGHCAVLFNADGQLAYASAADLSHIGRIVGITVNAADAGELAQVQNSDQLAEPGWTWDVTKPVYLGVDGALTQQVPALPACKFLMVVGYPISSTSLFVNMREPIILSA